MSRYMFLMIPSLVLLLGAAVVAVLLVIRALHAFHGMFG